MTNTRPAFRSGDQTQTAAQLENEWKTDARWNGIEREFTADDVIEFHYLLEDDAYIREFFAKRG